MRRLDDWLFDRLFQPLCDHLADHASCFDLARSAAVGTGILATASFLALEPDALVCLGILVWLTLMVLLLIRIGDIERWTRRHQGTANAERLTGCGWRLMNDMWLAWMLLRLALAPATAHALLMMAGSAALVASMYFMACTRSPPKRQQARVGPLATASAR